MNRSATRRLWLYGLLLLLPALAVGGLALGLLAREQTRLAERELAARESRRAAVETRARLIAENIELLVGDVQSALMTTLLEAPAAEPRAFLTEWQATNPLVREVFRVTAEGRPVWGAVGDPLRTWLAQGPPWVSAPAEPSPVLAKQSLAETFAAKAEAPAKDETKGQMFQKETDARRDISNNVNQYQRARQEIQEVAKVKNYADVAAQNSVEPRERSLGSSASFLAAAPSPPAAAAPAARAAAPVASATPAAADYAENAPALATQLESVSADLSGERKALAASERLTRTNLTVLVPTPITRSGWTPWSDASGLHLFGWRELPDRTVVGLELRLDAIKARLGEVFPATPAAGEGYALRDTSGRSWHTVGGADLPVALEVPLAGEALPGWTVVGYALAAGYETSSPRGFFALGATLIGLLVLAILAAGALLLRQVRLSEAEASLKTSFVANVSHELKTPLTTIRLYAELLEQGRVRDPAKQADYLATIGRETQRLGRLVGNVLDFSRLEEGKKKYNLARSDLGAALRRLAEVQAPRLAEAGLVLECGVGKAESIWIHTDLEAVEQIVLNLLDNAAKYAADGGEIRLSVANREEGGVMVMVRDRGPGVPDGQHERIFEKFHRVDDRLTAEKSGAGLGLSIARQLARGLGGDLSCGNRVEGGAAFMLELPGPFERTAPTS
jgi:two-component system, OmpR family, phosphate regulon sensor histidine kinase PhoR